MTTRSGIRFWPTDPRPDEVVLEDIAHSLSFLCRWNGHCSKFISVAQHSILVAEMAPPDLRSLALLHDAHEAYLGDITRPVMRSLPLPIQTVLQAAKDRLDTVIFNCFGLPSISLQAVRTVKEIDNRVLATEARDYAIPADERWWDGMLGVPYPWTIRPLMPGDAREEFLRTAAREGIQ